MGMSIVGPSVGPIAGMSATRFAFGDAPLVAAPPDMVGGVTAPTAPIKAAATPGMPEAAMAEANASRASSAVAAAVAEDAEDAEDAMDVSLTDSPLRVQSVIFIVGASG